MDLDRPNKDVGKRQSSPSLAFKPIKLSNKGFLILFLLFIIVAPPLLYFLPKCYSPQSVFSPFGVASFQLEGFMRTKLILIESGPLIFK